MIKMFYHLEVAPARSDEAERVLRDWASRMKGNTGFLGCYVLKEVGHHAGEFGLMHDWQNSEGWYPFCQKNQQFGALIPHHSHEEEEEQQKELFHMEFHGHYQLIFQVLP